jgi:hypothetical protein
MLIAAQTGFGTGAVDQTRHHQSKSYASSRKQITMMKSVHLRKIRTSIYLLVFTKYHKVDTQGIGLYIIFGKWMTFHTDADDS